MVPSFPLPLCQSTPISLQTYRRVFPTPQAATLLLTKLSLGFLPSVLHRPVMGKLLLQQLVGSHCPAGTVLARHSLRRTHHHHQPPILPTLCALCTAFACTRIVHQKCTLHCYVQSIQWRSTACLYMVCKTQSVHPLVQCSVWQTGHTDQQVWTLLVVPAPSSS